MLVKTKSWSRLREPMRAETALTAHQSLRIKGLSGFIDTPNQLQRVWHRLAKRRVVENAPGFPVRRVNVPNLPGGPSEILRGISRVVHPRRTVQAAIRESGPSARIRRPRHRRRVGRRPGNLEFRQRSIHGIGEPRWMTRLAHHLAIEPCPEKVEESAYDCRVT